MRLNYYLTNMQVNSLIIMAEEASMQLTPDTNFNTLRDDKQPSRISVWVSYCRKIYVELLSRYVLVIL